MTYLARVPGERWLVKMSPGKSVDGAVAKAEGVRWRDAALMAYARACDHPFKIRIVHWLVRLLTQGRIHVRYAPTARIVIDPADYIGWAIFKAGHYEPASLNLALRLLRQDPGLFVDVGASFGWYTCAVASIAGASVIGIEPDCENCASLRRNIALNRLNNTAVFNGAVSDESALVKIGRRSRGNSGTVTIAPDDGKPGQGAWVAAVSLNALLQRMVTPAVRPVLIKIDVEGLERQVLAGLDFDGPFRPKNILFEFDRQLSKASWETFGHLQAFFTQRGYDLFDVFGTPLRGADSVPEDNVWACDRAIA